ISEPVAAFGRSRGTDFETMSFAVTMKMMRRTRTMSTSGVTLIPVIASSESELAPPPISVCFLFRAGRLRRLATLGLAGAVGLLRGRLERVLDRLSAATRGLQVREQDVRERLGVRQGRPHDALERVERCDGG